MDGFSGGLRRPQPWRDELSTTGPGELTIGGDEILVGRFGGLGRGDRRRDQDAIAERDASIGRQGEIQRLLALAENFLPERVGGEKTVTTGVPVGWKARIGRVVENGDGYGLVADETAEITPAAARAPGGVAFLAFTGEVGAVDADVVQLGDGSGAATAVGVDLRFAGRDFESTDHAKAQEAVFFVRERDFFMQSAQGGDALDAAESRPATKDEVGMLLEQYFLVVGEPIRFHIELALFRTAFCRNNGTMENGAHLWGIFRFDGVGIVPEIDAVDTLVVEPKAGVMRMIDAFAGALLERKAASDDGAFGGAQRIENGFSQGGRPDVGSEGLAIDEDVDAASVLVCNDGDSFGWIWTCGDERSQKHNRREEKERRGSNENAHG